MNGFVLVDNDGRYIYRDKHSRYTPVSKLEAATVFQTKQKAQNILNSCLPKIMRSRFHIEEIKPRHVTSENQTVINKPVKNRLDAALAQYSNTAEKISKWSESVTKIAEFAREAEAQKTELTNALSEVDKEITDIQHYIELGTFNAYQGWEAFSFLRSCLIRRRQIKDELVVVSSICDCPIGTSALSNVLTTAKGVDKQVYGPRVLRGLFSNAAS